MKLLVCVLNETQRLNDLLKAMAELGISGATVLESQGMAKFLAKEAPVIAGLRHLVTQGRTFNYTILSVVEDDAIADRTMKAIEDHLLPGTRPGTHGVAFTLPVDKFVHFHPHGQEVRWAGEPSTAPSPGPSATTAVVPEVSSSFERAMLAALKRGEATQPGLLSKLLEGIKAVVLESDPSRNLKERRRASRVECEFRVSAELDGLMVESRITEIGVFGLTLRGGREFPLKGVVEISPPHGLELEDTDTIRCIVVSSGKDGEEFRAGLVYHEPAEELSNSWLAQLLRELGYSVSHLAQRRRLRRIEARVPAELQTLGGDCTTPAVILDIGMEGALVETDANWPEGSQVGVLLGPYEKHEALYVEGLTVDMRESEGKWLHSVRFFDLESRRVSKLGALVIDLLKKPAPTT